MLSQNLLLFLVLTDYYFLNRKLESEELLLELNDIFSLLLSTGENGAS